MIGVDLFRAVRPRSKILCIGAHSDDIEIGCGGALLKLLDACPDVEVHWVVLCASGIRKTEAESSAKVFLANVAEANVITKAFRNGYFPQVATDIKDFFESLKSIGSPNLVFTHYGRDAHQDHRTVSELTWNTFRDNLILEYEIPKYDGDLASPNAFVTLSEDIIREKSRILHACFNSQHDKHWFSESTFRALARIRGIECNSGTGFAEAFFCRKILLA